MANKILVFIVILLAGNLHGQASDYIITQNHDTIYGKIRKSNSTKFVNFKKDGNTIRYKASFGAIRGFYMAKSDEHYDNVEIPKGWESKNKSMYLWRMTKGDRIKLYFHGEGTGVNYIPTLYILKEGQELANLPTNGDYALFGKFAKKSTIEKTRPFLADNQEALRILDKIIPTSENFVNLINRYNESFANKK